MIYENSNNNTQSEDLEDSLVGAGYRNSEVDILLKKALSLNVGEIREFGDEERAVQITRTDTGFKVMKIY
jgi:hypothetical protein